MTDRLDLARRAVACKHWRPMSGMMYRQVEKPHRWKVLGTEDGAEYMARWYPDYLPDLTDPATIGCLLALVREAWSDPEAHAVPLLDGTWGVSKGSLDWIVNGCKTEAAALVAALEAAP